MFFWPPLTWLSADAALFPLACAMFSQVHIYYIAEDLINLSSRPRTQPRHVKNVSPAQQIAHAVFKVRSPPHSLIAPRCYIHLFKGECNILEDNLVNIIGNVESVEMCENHCTENSACNFFTYLGEENQFRSKFRLCHNCYVQYIHFRAIIKATKELCNILFFTGAHASSFPVVRS